MTAIELFYEAERLMKSHGVRAELHCAVCASKALALGNLQQSDHWERMRAVVNCMSAIQDRAA
jgi:hypothetical protein